MLLNELSLRRPDGGVIGALATGQRGLPLLVFLHGNGFAAGIYSPMFAHLTDQFDLIALDIPGHGRSDAVRPYPGWNDAAECLHQTALATGMFDNRAVYGIGHSLGGALTLLSAYRHAGDYRGLVLLDPIIFPPRQLLLMRIVRALGLTAQIHPHIKATLRRRRNWRNRPQVIEYFANKSVFKQWTDESLECFSQYAIRDCMEGVALACDPEVEAHFFGSLPSGLWRAIEGLDISTAMIMGQYTYPFAIRAAQMASERNRLVTDKIVSGSHCFMLENPGLAAAEVVAAIEQLQ